MPDSDRFFQSPVDDRSWAEVLAAVDRTYAELVQYQDQLEQRNSELLSLRRVLSSILESMSDYLIAVNKGGRIEEASTSFTTFVGTSKVQLEGRRIHDFLSPQDGEKLETALSSARLGQGSTLELDIIGTTHVEPVEFRIAPRSDQRGRSIGAVLTGRPQGKLRRMYSDLATSHAALKQAQSQLVNNEKLASLGRLLAGVAHELNNPISFVYANTHALEKYVDRFETYFHRIEAGASREELAQLRTELKLERELKNLRTAIGGAHEGAERVRDIVADLRRLSSDGSGEFVNFDLTDVARVAASWIQRGMKSPVTISFGGQEGCQVRGRPGHIQQVLLNLIQNAFDATAEQTNAAIHINIVKETDWIYLEVSDNGPGVSEEVAAEIFDPFFTTKPVGRGTGLGLSISLKIAEEHGGTLQLHRYDTGVTFCLALPGEADK